MKEKTFYQNLVYLKRCICKKNGGNCFIFTNINKFQEEYIIKKVIKGSDYIKRNATEIFLDYKKSITDFSVNFYKEYLECNILIIRNIDIISNNLNNILRDIFVEYMKNDKVLILLTSSTFNYNTFIPEKFMTDSYVSFSL